MSMSHIERGHECCHHSLIADLCLCERVGCHRPRSRLSSLLPAFEGFATPCRSALAPHKKGSATCELGCGE